jgi:hypothetical protein
MPMINRIFRLSFITRRDLKWQNKQTLVSLFGQIFPNKKKIAFAFLIWKSFLFQFCMRKEQSE